MRLESYFGVILAFMLSFPAYGEEIGSSDTSGTMAVKKAETYGVPTGAANGQDVVTTRGSFTERPPETLPNEIKCLGSGEDGLRDAEIERRINRSGGALQAIYRRALRDNRDLSGSMKMLFNVEKDGSVSSITSVSTGSISSELERILIIRARVINFGTADATWKGECTVQFLP